MTEKFREDDTYPLWHLGLQLEPALASSQVDCAAEAVVAAYGADLALRYVEVQVAIAAREIHAALRKPDPSWALVDNAVGALATIVPDPTFPRLRLILQTIDRAGPFGLKVENATWLVAASVIRQVLAATKHFTQRATSITLSFSEEFPFVYVPSTAV
jgi:hypothetical protein